MLIRIVKFELYPADLPTGYAVGYNVTTSNNRFFYIDTIVPLRETTMTDLEILDLAWDNVKDYVLSLVTRLLSKSAIIGNNWIPKEANSTLTTTTELIPLNTLTTLPIEELILSGEETTQLPIIDLE